MKARAAVHAITKLTVNTANCFHSARGGYQRKFNIHEDDEMTARHAIVVTQRRSVRCTSQCLCLKMFARTTDVSVLTWSAMWLLALRVQASPLLLVYSIEEDCQLGTLLADIKTDSRLSEHYNKTVVDQLHFVMLATQSGVDSRRHFDIDELTGLVRAASSLDRDDICPAALNCILNVDFAVQPAAYFQLIKVNYFCCRR